MSTPEARVARLEEAIETLKRDLHGHIVKEEATCELIKVSIDRNFRELLNCIHILEVNILQNKADTSRLNALTVTVSRLKSRFWILVGLLVGSGLLGASALQMLTGG